MLTTMMAVIAYSHKAALDVGPLLYLIIVVIWIASAIRSAARAAARQRRAIAESSRPATAASSPPTALRQSTARMSQPMQAQISQQQLQAQLQQLRRQLAQSIPQPLQETRVAPRPRRPAPQSTPAVTASVPAAAQQTSAGMGYGDASSDLLPPPEVPVALQLKDAVAAFGGAATPQEALVGGPPASLATDYTAPTPQTRLTPLTTQNAVVNAIVGAAVLGPCAAYRTSNQDLIGW